MKWIPKSEIGNLNVNDYIKISYKELGFYYVAIITTVMRRDANANQKPNIIFKILVVEIFDEEKFNKQKYPEDVLKEDIDKIGSLVWSLGETIYKLNNKELHIELI